jgi:hypothetical protein
MASVTAVFAQTAPVRPGGGGPQAVVPEATPSPRAAETPPFRVVQGTDGSLYLVQGSTGWTLVPDRIDDVEVAALTLYGVLHGTLPDSAFEPSGEQSPGGYFVSPSSDVSALTPGVSGPPPTVAPEAAPILAGDGPVGKNDGPPPTVGSELKPVASSNVQGALIAVGGTYRSKIDRDTKPMDYFAVVLSAGQRYEIALSAVNGAVVGPMLLQILNPDSSVAETGGLGLNGITYLNEVGFTFTPATSDTYNIEVQTQAHDQAYELTVRQL